MFKVADNCTSEIILFLVYVIMSNGTVMIKDHNHKSDTKCIFYINFIPVPFD
jgi:hypothetical protein